MNKLFISLLPFWTIIITIIINMILISWKRMHLINFLCTLIGLIFSLIFCIFYSNQNILFFLLKIDNYTIFYTSLIFISSIINCIFAFNWLEKYTKYKEEFYLLILLSTLGVYILLNSYHMITLFIGIELISLPLFGLLGYSFEKKYSLEATIKYFILSSISSSILLLGISYIYIFSGDLNFVFLKKIEILEKNLLFLVGISMIISSIGFKLSFFPFHFYTPDIYQGTSNPTTYFFASIKIFIFSFFARLIFLFPELNKKSYFIFQVMSFFSIFFGSFMAIKQIYFKRLIAYSSITHFGYLLISLLNKNHLSLEAVNIYLINYFLSTIGLFGIIHLVSIYKNSSDKIKNYKGLFWYHPKIAIALTIIVFSLAGIPFTLGFISKFYIMMIAINAKLWSLIIITVIASIIGIYYYTKIIVSLFLTPEKKFLKLKNTLSTKIIEFLVFISCFFTILFGIYPSILIKIMQKISKGLYI